VITVAKGPTIKHLVAFVRYASEECDRIDHLPTPSEGERALERLYGRLEAFETHTDTQLKQKAMQEAGIWRK
jgi:hypothetical protein